MIVRAGIAPTREFVADPPTLAAVEPTHQWFCPTNDSPPRVCCCDGAEIDFEAMAEAEGQ